MSEELQEQEDTISVKEVSTDAEQMVPVSEAIKYRRRAQAAEQKAEQLRQQLQESQHSQEVSQASLQEVRLDNELTQKLVQAGVVDVEAALLLAKNKMAGSAEAQTDVRSLIETLQNERPYLFAGAVEDVRTTLAGPTAGIQSGNHSKVSTLSRLAQQVQQSGSRKDMQEYLRLRRGLRR